MDDGEATSGELLTLAELTARGTLDDLEVGPLSTGSHSSSTSRATTQTS